jgi:hypothetical protein
MTTHTLTRREVETVDTLLKSFQYWDTIGDRWTDRHVPNLQHAYRGNWFSADSRRFFGSRNLHLHRAGMLVETMTTAPDGTVWGLTAWTMDEGRPVPVRIAYFSSLRAARRFAELADAVWTLFVACHALRAAGCPGTVDELIELTALTGVAA